jgi:hypothetical protein
LKTHKSILNFSTKHRLISLNNFIKNSQTPPSSQHSTAIQPPIVPNSYTYSSPVTKNSIFLNSEFFNSMFRRYWFCECCYIHLLLKGRYWLLLLDFGGSQQKAGGHTVFFAYFSLVFCFGLPFY